MKIICIGRNYLKHAREMDSPVPTEPIFFMKPESAIIKKNKPFFLPDFSKEIHHEVELVLQICRLGKNIAPEFAHRYYDKIGVGIDFTARDIQRKCIENGLSWEKAKAFDGSAPLGKFVKKENLGDVDNIDFKLEINKNIVQHGNTKDLIFPFDELIAYVSRFFTLKTGDLIFTGTPEGVGPVNHNDELKAYINNELLLDFIVK
ncbi:MAG: fumarylacetoacetate hydrolase family protein [Bacteroidetes bacterium]|nr:fumarylacetoacetate hydrolase family protein [Bacteroidota bacterium]